MRRIIGLLAGLIFFISCNSVQASPFGLSGNWRMNANGWEFVLELQEYGNDFSGTMRPSGHHEADTRVEGTITPDGKIEFLRSFHGHSPQRYVGYIFQGNVKHKGIAGTFTHNSPQRSGWFAERIKSDNSSSYQQTHKLFAAVPNQSSNNFKANTMPRFQVDTGSWDRTPYLVTSPFNGRIRIQPGQRVLLAGNEAGTQNWGIDNFIVLEFRHGHSIQRFVLGEHEPVSFDGQRIQKLGPGGFSLAPNAVDLAAYLPTNTPIQVTAYAMDYGGAGWVSDVYLIVR